MAGEIPSTTTTTTTTDADAYADNYDAAAAAAADNTGTAADAGAPNPTTAYTDGDTGDTGTGDTGAENTNANSTNTSTTTSNGTGTEGYEYYSPPDSGYDSTATAGETLSADPYQEALAQIATYDDAWMQARMAEFQQKIDAAKTPEGMQQVWQQNVLPVVNKAVPPPAEQMAQKKEEDAAQQHADQMSQADLALFANKDTAQALLKAYKNRLAMLTQAAKKSGSAEYQEYVKLLPKVNARQSDLANARERSRFVLEGQKFQAEEFVQDTLSDFNRMIFKAQKKAGKAAQNLALSAKEKFNQLKDNLGRAVAGEIPLFDKNQKALIQNQKDELATLAQDATAEDAGQTVKNMALDAEMREHEAGKINTQQAAEVDEAEAHVADLNNGAVPQPTTEGKVKVIALLEKAGRLTYEQAKELKDSAEKTVGNMLSGGFIAAAETELEAQSAAIQGLLANAAPALNGELSTEEQGQARSNLVGGYKFVTEGRANKLAQQKAAQVKAQVQAGVAAAQAKAQQVSRGVSQAVTYTQDTANEILTKTREELAEKTSFMKTTVGSWENSLDDAFGYYTQWTRRQLSTGNGDVYAGTVQAADPNKRVGP